MSRLDEPRQVLEAQLRDLDADRERLQSALDALNGKGKGSKRGPGRPAGSGGKKAKAAAGGRTRRRRRRNWPSRLTQMLQLVADKPGIATNDVAKALSMKPNYLYRLKSDAEGEGLLTSEKRKLTITAKGRKEIEAATAAAAEASSKGGGAKAKAGTKSKAGAKAKASK